MEKLLAFLVVIGPLIFIHELGHFIVAKWRGVRVERFSLGYPPRLFGFRKGDTDYCVSAVPLGGYVKMAGENPEEPTAQAPDEFMSKSTGSRAMIIAAGPVANYVLAIIAYVAIVWLGGEVAVVDKGLWVGELLPESPAEVAGLVSGDLILEVDGEPVADFDALLARVSPSAGRMLRFTILRDRDTLRFDIVPRATTNAETGLEEGKIGFYSAVDFRPVGAGTAIKSGIATTWHNTGMVVRFLGRLVTGRESLRNVGGPLFIASVAGEVAEQGWRYFLGLIAFLSINLAFLNILPIPVLDGGQLLFILIEKLKGKPLGLEQRIRIQQIGLAFLLVFIIFVTINDLVRVLS